MTTINVSLQKNDTTYIILFISVSSSDPNSSRNDDFQLPTIPSDDWEMNVFLKELADGLTDEDLKTMKHFVSGRVIDSVIYHVQFFKGQ